MAQPPNDNCNNAIEIPIGNNGFDKGVFTSALADMNTATIQTGETFAPSIVISGLNKRSVWYKFNLPTTRSVRVSILQPGSDIQAGNVGFAVYKADGCLPSNTEISTKLSPIETFGNTFHPCVNDGQYYVQVSSNTNANGEIFLTVETGNPSGLYDLATDPQKFGLLTNKRNAVDFDVDCQGIEDISEICLPNTSFKDFTKSTWHTFTTPNYYDYIAILLSEDYEVRNNPYYTVGYRIYEGNSETTPVSGLTLVGGCDSMVTNGYYPDRKIYSCGDLKTNTTYTIQLIYPKDFVKTMRLGVVWNGSSPTNGPEPVTTISPKNKIGVLPASPAGLNTYVYDTFACNSIIAPGCGPASPVEGITVANYRYRLNTFFSFTLSSATSIQFYSYADFCNQPYPLIRVFKQPLGTNCNQLDTANLLGQFVYQGNLNCLEAGDYIVQVMGSDTVLPKTSYNYGSILNNRNPICLMSNFGNNVTLRMIASSEIDGNKFGLNGPDKVNKINANAAGVLQPLVPYQIYASTLDTFGCRNTVLPNDPDLCAEKEKASYKIFNVSDSGLLYHTNSARYNFKVYRGDANALAIAQNKFGPDDRIDGLIPISKCSYFTNFLSYRTLCVEPGTYTHANFGNQTMLGFSVDHDFVLRNLRSVYSNPANPEDLGSILDTLAATGRTSITTKLDTFDCYDNPVNIDGLIPCNVSNRPATKLLYRQFYLSEPSRIRISLSNFAGNMRLFSGKVSESGIAGLKSLGAPWNCFTNAATSSNQCDVLEVGWYTVVAYGDGPSYEKPLGNYPGPAQISSLGLDNAFTIFITPPCARPKNNRPFKASVTASGKPHNVDWVEQAAHSPAYPVTYTTTTLPADNFDCSNDTPFVTHPVLNCAPAATGLNQLTKVSYHVWEITKYSYIQITLPANMWGVVYPFDVRKDSSLLTTVTPIQPCMDRSGLIQLCKMEPGVYTLVVFGRANMICNAVAPVFYVDSAGFSRFDHAMNAYDFGTLIPDKQFRNGKPGDTNPLHPNRPPSNDFFYCTTGAQEKDPSSAACLSDYKPEIYQPGNNVALYTDAANPPSVLNIARRNLWYTFTINDPGTVYVKVDNKTAGKLHQYPFAIYKSDVDGSLDFDAVKAGGEVDSTFVQGLSFVKNNFTGFYCYSTSQINIFNDPCTFKPTRYYVVVENRNPYWAANIHAMNPNSQVEVSVRLDSVQVIKPKFDHYALAGDMGTVGAGIFRGETDNITCATRSLSDPVDGVLNNCQKNIWYKFTTTVTGNIRYRVSYNNTGYSTKNQIQLFQSLVPGDSTSKGLAYLPNTTTEIAGGFSWMRRCISPGTYYLLLPGCGAVNEFVYPEIEILEQEGDFCSKPMVTNLAGPGTRVLPVIIDCHTIGTDYGEFNPTLTCPAGGETNKYKTSWYRLDITGNDTLDVTVFIDEKTNALPAEIKYRLMTGTCAAMQEQSCVQDALTRNTYKCLAPGNSYYIQVFTPVQLDRSPFSVVTGSIDLNIEAVAKANVCNPADPCIAVANFTPRFDCTKDRFITFENYSTFGTDISYSWDLGYNNQKSTEVTPRFFYPALTIDKKYTVKLIVTNNDCGKKDSITQEITIPARPSVDLGPDTILCTNGSSVTFDATSHTGSTYRWSDNRTTPVSTYSNTSTRWVQVTFNNCIARDTVNIWINPIVKKPLQTLALCNTDQVAMDARRNQGEQYTWSNGSAANSITEGLPGFYWVDLFLNGCTIRDSFLVVSTDLSPLGADISLCSGQFPFTANATVGGATSYKWQNNVTTSTLSITQPGIYWVDITLGGCTFRDSLIVGLLDTVINNSLAVSLCPGESYQLPGGTFVNKSGIFRDTLRYQSGCDSLVTTVTITIKPVQTQTVIAQICEGENYRLPGGTSVSVSGSYRDTLRSVEGCDSLIITTQLTAKAKQDRIISALICAGDTYRLPSGKLVNSTGTFRDTLKYVAGCDSIIFTVTLSASSGAVNTNNAFICSGQSYTLPTGRVVSSPGIYRDTLRYESGCDSIITITNLTAFEATSQSINAAICSGAVYLLPSGKSVNTTGTYRDTLRYASGCDSIRFTIQLAVTNPVVENRTSSVCSGDTLTLPSGRKITIAGLYRDTLRTISGCDSLVTITNLFVQSVSRDSISMSLCSGGSFRLPSGRVVTTTGIYRDALRSVSGCDSSISTINLIISPVQIQSATVRLCNGESYSLPSGKTINVTGTYNDTLFYTSGCDSIRYTINLIVSAPVFRNVSVTLCAGETYNLPTGRVVSATGIYRDTLKTISGCDSLITVTDLKIQNLTANNLSRIICEGESYQLPSGRRVSISGIYRDTLRYTTGCDSLITVLQLSLQQVTLQNLNPSICAGAEYMSPSGKRISSPGTYQDTLRYTTGCDSIRYNINLTVNQPIVQRENNRFCSGSTFNLPWGRTVSAAGTYTDTIKYTNGCDSLIRTITLVEDIPVQQTFTTSVCTGAFYTLPSGRRVSLAGNYPDTIRNQRGCDSVLYNINIMALAVLRSQQTTSICAGETITLPGGRRISTGGVYQDTLRSVNGCDSIVTTTVTVKAPLSVSINGPDEVCFGLPVTLTATASGGNGGPYTFDWPGFSNSSNTLSFNINQTANIRVTVSDGCTAVQGTAVKNVRAISLPQVDAGVDTAVVAGTGFVLRPNYSTDVSRYRWLPSTGLSCSNCAFPTATITDATTYTIQVENSFGCRAEDSRAISILCNANIVFLPNTFTPNGDGMNDIWYPRGKGISTIRYLKVFNRWGQVVFERSNFKADDRSAGWDGTFKNAALPPDVFVYSLGLNCENGQRIETKGNVMIVR